MLFGPIFEVEARLTARRPRLYVIRVCYGLLLLAGLFLTYRIGVEESVLLYGDARSHRGMAQVGTSLFLQVITFQLVAVFALTPSLVASAIAGDRQRGILLSLLVSQLSSAEIVLGKVAARVLLATMTCAVGLPVIAIVSLLGGVEPWLLAVAFAQTGSLIWLILGFSIIVSVLSRTVKDAMILIYLVELAWLLIPLLLRPLLTIWWTSLQPLLWPVLRALEFSSPFRFASTLIRPADQWWPILTLILLELAAGSLFILASIVLLRRIESGPANRKSLRNSSPSHWIFRIGHPACTDQPMVWKECYHTRNSVLVRLGLLLVGVPLALMFIEQVVDSFLPSMRELIANGYGDSPAFDQQARLAFSRLLRDHTAGLASIWIVALASTAATAITSEREEDTWDSLRCTPLTSAEILKGKCVGAFRRFRLIAYALFLLWFGGLISGAIHPLAIPLMFGTFLALSLFALGLGIAASVSRKNTTQALTLTNLVLLLANAAPLIFFSLLSRSGTMVALGFMPLQINLMPANYPEIQSLFGQEVSLSAASLAPFQGLLPPAIAGACLYGVVGWLLLKWAEWKLDERERAESSGRLQHVQNSETTFIENRVVAEEMLIIEAE